MRTRWQSGVQRRSGKVCHRSAVAIRDDDDIGIDFTTEADGLQPLLTHLFFRLRRNKMKTHDTIDPFTVGSWRAVRIIGTTVFLACAACTISACHKDDKSPGGRNQQAPVLTVRTRQLGPGQPTLLSIGVLASARDEPHETLRRFFKSNGIPCFIEGTLVFDVVVYESDFEKVRTLLKTNRPDEKSFHTVWDSR